MRKLVGVIVSAAAALLLSACVSGGSLANRGMSIDRSVGLLQNRALLLNLVRASRGEPLYFTSVGPIQAQGTSDLKIGLPTINEGPGFQVSSASSVLNQLSIGAGNTNILDNTINTSFTTNVFSTRDFYAGMMAPLGLDEIDLLLHQGYPREMIYYLVIDKAKITPINGKTEGAPHFIYNDPANPTYGDFVSAIEQAMEHGLTTEMAPSKGPPPAPPAGGGGDHAGPASAQVGTADKAQVQNCYEQALTRPEKMADFAAVTALTGSRPNFCGSGQRASSAYLLLDGKLVKIEISFRSIYGIFNYLGGVAAHPETAPVLVDYGVPSERTPAGPLLNVTAEFGDCFTSVAYEGRSYCVPQDADNTKRIFSILTALVALKQTPGQLPVSSTLLLAQ